MFLAALPASAAACRPIAVAMASGMFGGAGRPFRDQPSGHVTATETFSSYGSVRCVHSVTAAIDGLEAAPYGGGRP